MARGRPSPLEDPVARRLVLQLICLGRSQDEAGEEAGSSGKGIQRWARKHPVFAGQLARARELRGSDDSDAVAEMLAADPELVGVAMKDPDPVEAVAPVEAADIGEPPVPPAEEVEILPREVVDGEVVELGLVGAPALETDDPAMLVSGLPSLTERNLLAFYWRAIHDPKTPAGVVSTCIRALHDHTITRVRQARAIQLDHARPRQADSSAGSRAREKGLSPDVVWSVRRALIGPPPGDGGQAT